MLLVSYVSIRFASLSSGDIAIIVCYFIALILFALECTIDRLPYFDNLAQQNLAFLSRLLLPVLVIMPAQLHYSLFIFTGAILLLELLFTKNLPQASSLRQRTLLVRISELACWLMLGIYYVIDL